MRLGAVFPQAEFGRGDAEEILHFVQEVETAAMTTSSSSTTCSEPTPTPDPHGTARMTTAIRSSNP